jgi:hypothetical protein
LIQQHRLPVRQIRRLYRGRGRTGGYGAGHRGAASDANDSRYRHARALESLCLANANIGGWLGAKHLIGEHTEVEMDGAAILVDIEIPTRAAREIEYG